MVDEITSYEESDHDILVDIWYRAVSRTHTFLTDSDIQFYRDIVQNVALRVVEIWVRRNDNQEPTGFIGLAGTKIEMLFVDPEYHGMGIGSRLIRHAQKLIGSTIQVDVNEQNDGACAFYKRFGFVQIGRSELDSSGKPFPLLHLEYRSQVNEEL
ncbi:putative acetyltransferase [Paenibacillus forsythiae]|uniref:Acetyltransferase n=1 Tax=Paenibacillus forsythiae TaxID=365616 RepID=A0ABU3H6E5_9BACL|nr:acetyltransferase [Paenibacillus forsythiae]MDT3426393.1 putative acetyltransferase [Paenibacillus forsythiae]